MSLKGTVLPVAALPGMLHCVSQLAVWLDALPRCLRHLDTQHMQAKQCAAPPCCTQHLVMQQMQAKPWSGSPTFTASAVPALACMWNDTAQPAYPGPTEYGPTLPCSITSGTFGDGKYFQDLVDNVNDMTKGNDWFLVANDFATYMKAQDEVDAVSQGVGLLLKDACLGSLVSVAKNT